jgi:hypothetical protein
MGSSTGSWRFLGLTSPALAHGIRTFAGVYFFESQVTTSGVITNVDQPNFNGQRAYASCRLFDFAQWYDILRNERPLRCVYAYDGPEFDPSQPTRSLYWIQLTTAEPEPPGEGPEAVERSMFSSDVLKMLEAQRRSGE